MLTMSRRKTSTSRIIRLKTASEKSVDDASMHRWTMTVRQTGISNGHFACSNHSLGSLSRVTQVHYNMSRTVLSTLYSSFDAKRL
jgi:hypothetical protein